MFRVYFSHEKRIKVLTFSITSMDSDSWYDGLKANWYENYYKTNEQTTTTKKKNRKKQITDKSQKQKDWDTGCTCNLWTEGKVNKSLHVSVALYLEPGGATHAVYTVPAGYTVGRPVFLSWQTRKRSWVTKNTEKFIISEGKMPKKGSPNHGPPHFDLTTKELSVSFTILFQKNKVTCNAVADFPHPLRGVQDRNE